MPTVPLAGLLQAAFCFVRLEIFMRLLFMRQLIIGLLLLICQTTIQAKDQLVSDAIPAGTEVLLTASSELILPNDEVVLTFYLEQQEADKAKAASSINQKVKDAVETLKSLDREAEVKTTTYFTYPIYGGNDQRKIVAWRIRQTVQMISAKVLKAPEMVAKAQSTLALESVTFRLAAATRKRLDAQLFSSAYADLKSKIAYITQAMGKSEKDANVIRMDLSNMRNPIDQPRPAPMLMRSSAIMDAKEVSEPSLTPGETTESLSFMATIHVR